MRVILAVLLFFLVGCEKEIKSEASGLEAEIVALQTTEAKKRYLEEIFSSDQEFRKKLNDPQLSEAERQLIWQQIDEIDQGNLLKVQKYLITYGHPKKAEVGEIAAIAPWVVVHHQGEVEIRNSFFKPLYTAWLEGDIDDGQLSFYLNRTYELKRGKRNNMNGPYKTEEEIDLLIQKLGLQDQQSAVLEALE